MALILTGKAAVPPPGYAVVRHAEAAAIAEASGCACCRVPSDLVTALRQLFLERVRGDTNFAGLVIEGDPALIEPALADPLVAARYEKRSRGLANAISMMRVAEGKVGRFFSSISATVNQPKSWASWSMITSPLSQSASTAMSA
jgi:hypothetical protein